MSIKDIQINEGEYRLIRIDCQALFFRILPIHPFLTPSQLYLSIPGLAQTKRAVSTEIRITKFSYPVPKSMSQ